MDTQRYDLDKYNQAAQTLLDYAAKDPDVMFAPQSLFSAGRINERAGRLDYAARVWKAWPTSIPGASWFPRSFSSRDCTHSQQRKLQGSDHTPKGFAPCIFHRRSGPGLLLGGKAEQSLGDNEAGSVCLAASLFARSNRVLQSASPGLILKQASFRSLATLKFNVDRDTERREA